MTGSATPLLSAALAILVVLVCIGGSRAANDTDGNATTVDFEQYKEQLGKIMDDVFAKIPPSFMRKLQTAEISTDCSIGMLKMIRGIRNLDPWALRLIDASGKYPTGFLDGAKVDLGAFDECIDTSIRDEFGQATSLGQYCSLMFYNRNGKALQDKMEPILEAMHPQFRLIKEYLSVDWLHMLRLGICVLDDCTQDDLQALIDSVKPPTIDIEVANCVTREPEPWTATQKAILTFLATLATVITASTAVDLFLTWKAPRTEGGMLSKFLTSFSVVSNTRGLFQMPVTNSTEHTYRFLHGMRFLCMMSVVRLNSGAAGADIWARYLNFLLIPQKWSVVFVAWSANCMETFFFLSGFLMCMSMAKYGNRLSLAQLVVVPLRLIRTLAPAFFVIMCMYLIPLITAGPDFGTLMRNFYTEISEQWWHLLVQVRNLYGLDHKTVLGHYWYLSADFQAFLVSLPVYLLFRNRKSWAIGTFSVMSLVACGIAIWEIAGTDIPPFILGPLRNPQTALKMVNGYYILPFYHLVCYFSGCIVFLLSENFNKLKPSKALQAAGWCIAACCGLCAVFLKVPWYRNPTPTTEWGKLCTAFFDRILWSLFLSLITLACASGRGGFVGRFLSWGLFVSLSRLSFGVYLIHYPFIKVLLSTTRERLHYSSFNQFTLFSALAVWSLLLSYVLYVVCEAPAVKLSKLLFEGATRHRGLPRRKLDTTGKDQAEPVTQA